MDKKLLFAGAGIAIVGGIILLNKTPGTPGNHPEINPEDEPEDVLEQLEEYYDSLVEKYSDDPTLEDQLGQALNSASLALQYGGDLVSDPGYQMFVTQLNGYIAYRETIGYITFVDYQWL